ncbi:MAG TPA: CoA transferase [Pseudonocardia sp.]|jgi:crotonobetainyl-CoA:carnitine CoA-transferase CaiB-like acyl-CoA transferase|uniref:CoA transferase n=1 Tax=Pseudonocardia sp. TaxID=60912 RepID=UPI002B4B6675|nr:CoA transferase [Pseudonocardia sp.]HLU60378.1 CoA transferase [Pseudonocardia sp.]
MTGPPAPLSGRTVVDLSQYIAGAVCGQLLADFGADVRKVEPRGGDPSRALSGTRFGSVYYRWFNTGKTAQALDLRTADGRARLDALLADADALVMNFGLRTLERLDLTWEVLHRAHPHLVVTLVSAYGAGDPRTGFDSIAQAVSGYAVTNADEDGTPRIAAGWPTDVISGTYAAFATAMALADRDRTEGVLVDVPMHDVAMVALVGPAVLAAAEEGAFRRGTGNRDAATSPSNVYRCLDGHAYIYAGLDKHWERLAPVVGGPSATAAERLADAAAYDRIVEAWTSRHPVDEVCVRMAQLGIPAGPVRDPVAALGEVARERPGAVVATTPQGEAVPQFPVTFSGRRPKRRPAPPRPTFEESR